MVGHLTRNVASEVIDVTGGIALDLEGTPIDSFVWPDKALLLIGEEGPGLTAAPPATRIRIPTSGVESLNVVVAASIALSRIPQR